MSLRRREFGTLALGAVAASVLPRPPVLAAAQAAGVRIGVITYSFRGMSDAEAIFNALKTIGFDTVELMSNHAEQLVGAPQLPPGGRRGAAATPEQAAARQAAQQALRDFRTSMPMDRYKALAQRFKDAGMDVQILCFNMNANTSDDDMEYAFSAAKALGVRAISTSTTLTVAKRIAQFADKHKVMVGFHNHDNLDDPNEVATPQSFDTLMGMSKYHGVNLDIGHFTAANFDPVPYLREHHARITNLHVKDMKRNHGTYVPWGTGDTPIKQVLQLVKQEKWAMPADIEFEYPGDPMVELPKCLQYCKDALG
jgi:sugar phosphate isomerase/epimerase